MAGPSAVRNIRAPREIASDDLWNVPAMIPTLRDRLVQPGVGMIRRVQSVVSATSKVRS
jgi:hypothetical protein